MDVNNIVFHRCKKWSILFFKTQDAFFACTIFETKVCKIFHGEFCSYRETRVIPSKCAIKTSYNFLI